MTTPDANGWMPIETAPKDGRLILTFTDNTRLGFEIMTKYYAKSEYGWGINPFTNIQMAKEGWVDSCRQLSTNQPTHWQPLPAPPITNDGATNGKTETEN